MSLIHPSMFFPQLPYINQKATPTWKQICGGSVDKRGG
jgi:hypothetical protein